MIVSEYWRLLPELERANPPEEEEDGCCVLLLAIVVVVDGEEDSGFSTADLARGGIAVTVELEAPGCCGSGAKVIVEEGAAAEEDVVGSRCFNW